MNYSDAQLTIDDCNYRTNYPSASFANRNRTCITVDVYRFIILSLPYSQQRIDTDIFFNE